MPAARSFAQVHHCEDADRSVVEDPINDRIGKPIQQKARLVFQISAPASGKSDMIEQIRRVSAKNCSPSPGSLDS
jgi:hypothetical protein